MGEDQYCTPGNRLCRFTLDGVSCGIIICYDVRFPELVRSLTVPGLDVLFVVSQWPKVRTFHLRSLTTARAIENQMFVVCCNSCGTYGQTVYGGSSAIIDPWGETIALAGETQQLLTADCDLQILENIRSTIPVFRDRRPELYNI
jgi:predicted amidohydrolase